ncbi:MAG: YggS family pyridoxal phosphate-dependent enzyme [Clostridia bacterium]|nr:YggS family pyridoxal phosphate-dependent enzyme [Clostridia bacterium]
MDTEKKHFQEIMNGIAEAADRAGRSAGEIRLVGATKFKSPEQIRPVIEAGLCEVGENRAQEFNEKYDFFMECGVKTHFIGALQTNKAKYLVGRAALIQSVDRLELAAEINRLAMRKSLVQPILIEVNIGGEEQKSGIAPNELRELLSVVSEMPGVCVNGLMCVPPAVSEDEARGYFARMRELFLQIRDENIPNIVMKELSMGMSGDYKAAILEGSTMVRIGSALFGARPAAGSPSAH